MIRQLKKFYPLNNDIIFIDGIWGSGKSLLSPIVNNMEMVEMVKIEMIYEYICAMRHLDQISPSAASFFLQSYADDSQYNNLIGRHINTRWNDDSGFGSNPKKFKYIKRLFGGEGIEKIDEINKNNIALNIMSHMIILAADPLFDNYGDRLRIVEMVRHPLYMVKHWYSYLERFDSPRELTVCINYNGHKVPWFAVDWADEFVESTLIDRVLISIVKLFGWLDSAIDKAVAKGNRVLTISFESLALTPIEPLQQLEEFLGRKHHPNLSNILRKENIPRQQISQGKGHAAYGWVKGISASEEQAYANNLEFVNAHGSTEHVNNLLKLIETYNTKYPSSLVRFQ
jgi:hypothetical protein